MDESGNPVRRVTEKARARISPLAIVVILFLMFVGFMFYSGVKASANPLTTSSFQCPEAPAPFILMQNEVVEMDGQQVYVACGWVGGFPEETPPLPQQ